MKDSTKIFLKFTGGLLVAVAIFNYFFGLPWSFFWLGWGCYFVSVVVKKHSRIAAVLLTIGIIFAVAGTFMWQKIRSDAPVTYKSMPLIKMGYDVELARRLNPGNAKAKAVLYGYQNKQEEEAAKKMVEVLNKGGQDSLDVAVRIGMDQKRNRDKVNAAIDGLSSPRKPLFGGQKNHSSQVSGPVAPEPVKIYQPGTYTFSLKAGEETDRWIMFPVGTLLRLSLSSPDYGYNILFADGDLIHGGENVVLPNKARTKFKLIAVTDQEITMIVQDKRIAQK